MRWLYGIITILVVALIAGCGVRYGEPTADYPTIERLISDGWAAYDAHDYELAAAKFDSVTAIKADEVEAHIGAGWARTHNGDFSNGHASFAIAKSIEGPSPVIDVWKETQVGDGTWEVMPANTPILGFPSLQIMCRPRGTHPGIAFVLYDVAEFDDSKITLKWSAENEEGIDAFAPGAGDTILLDYSYHKGGETSIQIDSYCGEAAVSSANGEDLMAIIAGNAIIKMDPNYEFEKDANIDANMIHITLAQSYFNSKLFDNALREVLELDPNWTHNPNSQTFLYDLQKKIMELMVGS